MRHVITELPLEGCGLLAGPAPGDVRMVYPLDNVRRSRTSFTVEPAGHFRSLQHAEGLGWELVGVFHSHPASTAEPSPTDVRLAYERDWAHVIVGLSNPSNPELRAFHITGGVVSELEIRRP